MNSQDMRPDRFFSEHFHSLWLSSGDVLHFAQNSSPHKHEVTKHPKLVLINNPQSGHSTTFNFCKISHLPGSTVSVNSHLHLLQSMCFLPTFPTPLQSGLTQNFTLLSAKHLIFFEYLLNFLYISGLRATFASFEVDLTQV